MEHQEENEAIVEEDEDGGWVDTHHKVDPSGNKLGESGAQEQFSEMKLDSDKVLHFIYSCYCFIHPFIHSFILYPFINL